MHVTASNSHAPPPTVAVASDPSGLTFEEWTPPDGRDSFTINATELRGVNVTMTEADELPPLQSELRRSERATKSTEKAKAGQAKVTAQKPPPPPPRPKEYVMHQKIDDEIRARCW